MFGRTLKNALVIAAIAAIPMAAMSADSTDLKKNYASEDDFINFDGKDSKGTPNAEGTFAQRQNAQAAQVNANQEVPANTTAPAPKLSVNTSVTTSTATKTNAPAPKPANQPK